MYSPLFTIFPQCPHSFSHAEYILDIMAESSIYFDEFPSELNLQQLEDFPLPCGYVWKPWYPSER